LGPVAGGGVAGAVVAGVPADRGTGVAAAVFSERGVALGVGTTAGPAFPLPFG